MDLFIYFSGGLGGDLLRNSVENSGVMMRMSITGISVY